MRRLVSEVVVAMLVVLLTLAIGCRKGVDKSTSIPGRAAGHIGFMGGSAPVGYSVNSVGAAIPGSLPSPREELWVIAQSRSISNPSRAEPRERSPLEPRSGGLGVQQDGEFVPMPLKHTDVKADISGYIASVRVLQQFHNPFSNKIEATYVFPLPENAAIHEFIMTIGERRIRGIIREREEAKRTYEEARRQGYVASLLTQERPNIFSQAVANIEPGRAVDVAIQYFHTLAYDDGWYEFVFPMVVGPRFNPPGSVDGIGAVARDNQGGSKQRTEVAYLAPTERSGHDIALAVNIDAGVAIEETRCASHRVSTERASSTRTTVALSASDTIPNKDFVLRYRVAGDRIKSSFVTHEDARGGFFTMMLFPPGELKALQRQALELVFVLDCSGSMSGEPFAQAQAAVEKALDRMAPGDSFQIINFAERASGLGSSPLDATEANVERGRRYLRSLRVGGGTMMIEGIRAALSFPHDEERLRFVCFLTDGYIGNEREILAEIQRNLRASRVFSFGVGAAPNRFLMDSMARVGRGAVAYLSLKDDAAAIMDGFFNRISHPAMTDVEIDWGGLKVAEVYPARVPDLFVGRPVILTGRYQGRAGAVRVHGQAAGQPVAVTVPLAGQADASSGTGVATGGGVNGVARAATAAAALPSVWARLKIAELSQAALRGDRSDGEGLAGAIKQVALEYNLMSDYTAFVAVDASRRTAGGAGESVPVAVPVPEGVSYEKTVGKKERQVEE